MRKLQMKPMSRTYLITKQVRSFMKLLTNVTLGSDEIASQIKDVLNIEVGNYSCMMLLLTTIIGALSMYA